MSNKKTKAKRIARRVEHIDIRVGGELSKLNKRPLIRRGAKLGELADQPPLVMLSIGTLVAGLALGKPRLMRVGIRMTSSHMLATLAKGWVKHRIDRRRPHVADGHHRIEAGKGDQKSGQNSFPSGHSAGAAAVASAIVRDYPGAAPFAAAGAGYAVLARLPAAKHFPIDLIAGVAIGLVADAIVAALLARDDRPIAD